MAEALGRRFTTMVAPFAIATILSGCISPDPAPECPLVPTAPSPGISVPTFTCEAAIEAAKRALPFFHPRLTRIQFFYGNATSAILSDLPRSGFVVFTFDDGNRESVPVRDTGGPSLEVGSPVPD